MRVRHRRAQHESMRHSQKDYVVRVAASPGDKTQILMTPHRLTDTEFHAASSHSVGYGTYLWLHAIRTRINSQENG
jgi:hypothetical protein